MQVNSITYICFTTVTVVVVVLAVYGTSFKALPCFCLIMHSLKNNLKLECLRVPENVNHAIYIYVYNYLQHALRAISISKLNTDTSANNLQQAKCNIPLWNSANVLLPVCPDLLKIIPKCQYKSFSFVIFQTADCSVHKTPLF